MHYVVQENVFRESNYNLLIDSLERLQLPYDVVRVYPFINKVTKIAEIDSTLPHVDQQPDYQAPTEHCFVFGSLKLARICGKNTWKPGSLMDANHDFLVYREHYRENLLNWDSKIARFADVLEWEPGEAKFLRPCKDSKAFTGAVFNQKQWEEFVEHSLSNGHIGVLNADTEIQVSTPKLIQKEIRLWIVNGKVVTGSQYRLGGRVAMDGWFEEDAITFAEEMAQKFQLAKAFVMDVCLTDNQWKIVECGCINVAGFYCANLQKLLVSLEDNF